MTAKCETTIWCDGAGCFVWSSETPMIAPRSRSVELRAALNSQGWYCSRFLDLCPRCNPREIARRAAEHVAKLKDDKLTVDVFTPDHRRAEFIHDDQGLHIVVDGHEADFSDEQARIIEAWFAGRFIE